MSTERQRNTTYSRNGNAAERWRGIERTYTPADVLRLRGSLPIEHTLARAGAERLWALLHTEHYVPALGALTGHQAVQQVKAGLKAISSPWPASTPSITACSTWPTATGTRA